MVLPRLPQSLAAALRRRSARRLAIGPQGTRPSALTPGLGRRILGAIYDAARVELFHDDSAQPTDFAIDRFVRWVTVNCDRRDSLINALCLPGFRAVAD